MQSSCHRNFAVFDGVRGCRSVKEFARIVGSFDEMKIGAEVHLQNFIEIQRFLIGLLPAERNQA